jgi:hypothetical protein
MTHHDERIRRAARDWGPMSVAGFFTTLLLIVAVQMLASQAQAFRASRDGVPPADSSVITINQSDPTDMTQINRSIVSSLASAVGTVVCAAEFGASGGVPVLTVYDNRTQPQPLATTSSRWFTATELASPDPVSLVRQGSYLVRDPTLGGGDSVLPPGPTIGTFDGAELGQIQFVTTLSSYPSTVLPDRIVVRADDPALPTKIATLVQPHASVSIVEPETLWHDLAGYRYTLPLLIAATVGLLLLATVTADAIARRRPAWVVARLCGATRATMAWQAAGHAAAGCLVAALPALAISWLFLRPGVTVDARGLLSSFIVGLVVPAIWCGLITLVRAAPQRLRYREWSR